MRSHCLQFLILVLSLVVSAPAYAAVSVGQPAPEFTVTNAQGESVSLSDYKGKVVVLEWFNKGCPYVQKHYKKGDMQTLQEQFGEQGVVWLTINSTRRDHSDYLSRKAVENQVLGEWELKSEHYLMDPDGTVGRQFAAKTTPHMYIINEEGKIAYQGAIDDNSSAFSDPSEASNYVKAALEQHLAGKPITESKTKPYGCSVKYKD